MVAALSSAPNSSQFVADPIFKSASARQHFADSRALANPSYGPEDGFVGVDGAKALGFAAEMAPAADAPSQPDEPATSDSGSVDVQDGPSSQNDLQRITELEAALAGQQTEKEAEIERAKAQAFAEGQAQGQQEAKQMLEIEGANAGAQRAIELSDMLGELMSDARRHLIQHQDLFDPLKRLALSLAEHIARRELTLSDESLSAFIEGAIAEINPLHLNELVIHVSQDWFERLQQPELAEIFNEYTLRRDDGLQPGSVRLAVEDSSIDDFIEHRVSQLSEQLLGNTPPLPEPVAPGDLESVDAYGPVDPGLASSEFDDEGAIIQGDYSEVDDIFFQRPEED
jgi:flagellar biosynthesis/type III secretory pathway protein FliH